jgi:hypothetical protein
MATKIISKNWSTRFREKAIPSNKLDSFHFMVGHTARYLLRSVYGALLVVRYSFEGFAIRRSHCQCLSLNRGTHHTCVFF